ncbi:unnamed protein product [Camellia sinensis]
MGNVSFNRLNMATLRNLKIKTSTCKRIVKEMHSYEKEVEREAAKTADMKEKGADPYDLKQQYSGLAGVDMFRERSVEKIILVGVSGVGKTWTAKQLSKHAIKEGLFEIALWVFCNRKYHGTALSESIARQLSLLPIADEWEAEDSKKGEKEEENHEDLQTMIAKSLEKKKVLLILDDEGNEMKEG